MSVLFKGVLQFQFTHPRRGATFPLTLASAPRSSFNSRTPGGVRLETKKTYYFNAVFQFTHPRRGAT